MKEEEVKVRIYCLEVFQKKWMQCRTGITWRKIESYELRSAKWKVVLHIWNTRGGRNY